jgi:hypothetical protein
LLNEGSGYEGSGYEGSGYEDSTIEGTDDEDQSQNGAMEASFDQGANTVGQEQAARPVSTV